MMRKKITSLALLFMCCVLGAWAQNVADKPTPYSELTNGDYLVLINSGKTSDNGNFLFCKNNNPYVDYKTKGTGLIGSTLTDNDKAYIWTVNKSDAGVTITNKSTGKALSGNDREKQTMTLGNATTYKVTESGDAIVLSVDGSYRDWFSTKYYTAYIVNNSPANNYDVNTSETFLGTYAYSDDFSKHAEVAKFKFYKLEPFTEVTYNYVYDGQTRFSVKVNAVVGKAFPNPTINFTLPDYVSFSSTKPDGTYQEGTSFDLPLNVNLPFKTSTDEDPYYYYLVNDGDARTMIYGKPNKDDLFFRSEAQAENLNDARNDLWFVKGNPFDGFQFTNVGSGHIAKTNSAFHNHLCFNGLAGNISTWNVYKVSDTTFGITNGSRAWTFNGDEINFSNPATDNAHSFQFTPAVITLPLYESEADNAFFATTCLPYNVEIADGEEYETDVYAGVLNADKTELTMKNVGSFIPANQGVVLKSDMATEVTLCLNTSMENAEFDNDLQGTTTEISTEGILSFGRANGTDKVGFFRSENATLPANRAYIKINDESIQSVALNFGTVTGINNAANDAAVKSNAPVYDLSGRRVFNTAKGSLYIQQGRKFIAK